MRKYFLINFNSRINIPIANSFKSLDIPTTEYVAQFGVDKEIHMENISKIINEFKPDVIFSYGWWRVSVDIQKFEDIVKSSGAIHVFWAYDDPHCINRLTMPMAKICDYLFNVDKDSLIKYKHLNLPGSYLPFACDPSTHTKVSKNTKYSHDILLLANNYNTNTFIPFPDRTLGLKNIVIPLLQSKYDMKIYGLWWRDPDRLFILDKKFYGGIAPHEDISTCYSSCKIALGLLSVIHSSTMLSMRVFEVLGCGCFFLSQHSKALENIFKNKIHLTWSTSKEETYELVDYYLKNHKERIKIAKQGQEFVYQNHTYFHRAYKIYNTIEDYFFK